MNRRRFSQSSAYSRSFRGGESPSAPRPAIRSMTVFAAAVAATLFIVAACSSKTGHQALVFFFDGVPPVEAEEPQVEVEILEEPAEGVLGPPQRVEAAKKYYHHPAYWENRCNGCHEGEGGGLLKPVREGLCQMCHPDKPARKKFLHGPMAVNDCLSCHLYHKSPYPKVLVADAQTLCFHCHETGELRTDEHHKTIEEERCIDCHDAHGGDDRFFLIKKEDKEEAVDSSGNALIIERKQ